VDEAISTVSTGWAKAVVEIGTDVAMNRTRKQIRMFTKKLLFISNSSFQEVLDTLLHKSSLQANLQS
jgi:hypothetical protein